jgi:hypothetical protein
LTKDHIDDYFRAFAERARRELVAAADRRGASWSFEVVRGPLAADTLRGEHDFLVAGSVTRPIGDHFRISSRCWSWMAIVTRPFLLAKREWETGGSVFTLLRGRGPESARTLDIAAQIAGFHSGTLAVAGTPDLVGSDAFSEWVSGLLEGHSLSFQTEPAETEPDALRRRIIELDCRLLVLEASDEGAQPEDLRELVEQVACDVLIIR